MTATPYSWSTVQAPLPIAWTPGRDRGAAPDRGPRCTEPACPVVFASGESRPCRMHQEAEAGTDPRLLALGRHDPSRNHVWPKVRDLTPAERAELTATDGPADTGA